MILPERERGLSKEIAISLCGCFAPGGPPAGRGGLKLRYHRTAGAGATLTFGWAQKNVRKVVRRRRLRAIKVTVSNTLSCVLYSFAKKGVHEGPL